MNEEPRNPWIDQELEARIVNLVLGEASDVEREQLDRLIEARPELATLKKRIEAVPLVWQDQVRIEVLEASRRRIERVRIERLNGERLGGDQLESA